MRNIVFGLLILFNSSLKIVAQNVGIGTNAPQQNLSVQNGLNIDQGNSNNSVLTLTNGLRFGGGASGEGISSTRDEQTLNLFTNGNNRLLITKNGLIGINNPDPFARIHMMHSGSYQNALWNNRNGLVIQSGKFGHYQLLTMGADSLNQVSYINADSNSYIAPRGSTLLLQSGVGRVCIGDIVSPTNKLEVNGSVRVVNHLIVKGDKGIIRNVDDKQIVKQLATATVTGDFTAYQTRTFNITWPEQFSFVPEAYVGNVAGGTGGWAELVMSIANISATGASLYVFNPRNIIYTPNFTVNILAFGRIE